MANDRGFVVVEGMKIPSSCTFKPVLCGNEGCRCIHLVGYDEQKIPVCEMALDREQLKALEFILMEAGK